MARSLASRRYMAVYHLAAKFRIVRNLKLAKTRCMSSFGRRTEDLRRSSPSLRSIRPGRTWAPRDARYIMAVGRARGHYGDYQDATLKVLADLATWETPATWHPQAIAALER